MAKIHFLGTCSGTEPMKNMHHTSTLLEVDGYLYWFDAGECCVHTAYTSGVDVMKSRAVFVTHPHIDHVGGLANLFFVFDKIIIREGRHLINENELDIFFPHPELLRAIKYLSLSGLRDNFKFKLNEHTVFGGVIFRDERITVTAYQNNHLAPRREDGESYSYSYLVETEGKRFVLSGDVKSPSDLDSIMTSPVELLVMETGHHKLCDVLEYAKEHEVKNLRLNHHGREILADREAAIELTEKYEDEKFSAKITHDGLTEEF